MFDKYSDLKEKLTQLFDRTTLEATALVLAEPKPGKFLSESPPDWMTASQLARSWQLGGAYDSFNCEVIQTTGGPASLASYVYVGLLRFNRPNADPWTK